MKGQPILTLGCLVMTLAPAAARAQAAAPVGDGGLAAVVREIRLLRQAIEKQSATAARAQLLIGRLALQDQRLARARQAVERLEGELAGAEREQNQMRTAAHETAQLLEQVTDDDRRQQLERQSRMMQARQVERQTEISKTQARLSLARQALDAEAGRYDELEAWLSDLDRQIEGGGR